MENSCMTQNRDRTCTLVIFQGEVRVVDGLWSQAVVEVLPTKRLVWIYCCHGLDQLDYRHESHI